jgi:hypothetical protein
MVSHFSTGKNQSDSSNDREPLNEMDAGEGSSRQAEGNTNDGGFKSETKRGKAPADNRAAYAKQLQRACKTALQRVKQDNVLANSTWAEPLAAAPAAISVMAFLLKTAADKKVAGLTVSDLVVKDVEGKDIGKLP